MVRALAANVHPDHIVSVGGIIRCRVTKRLLPESAQMPRAKVSRHPSGGRKRYSLQHPPDFSPAAPGAYKHDQNRLLDQTEIMS
jgi:hypothetical protein